MGKCEVKNGSENINEVKQDLFHYGFLFPGFNPLTECFCWGACKTIKWVKKYKSGKEKWQLQWLLPRKRTISNIVTIQSGNTTLKATPMLIPSMSIGWMRRAKS